ncbi:MAG: transcription-repair coupling factor [Massiliimalia sp.]|jgi:transcription-repair coupling factor (superfamily II helicase)
MRLYQNIAERLPQFNQMVEHLKVLNTPLLTIGLSDIHKAHFIYAASQSLGQPVLVVTDDEAAARRMCDDINTMHGEEYAFVYPSRDFTFRQVESVSREYEQLRIGVLSRILNGSCPICFCGIEALLQYTIPPSQLRSRTFTIKADGSYEMERLVEQLVRAGYSRRPQVEGIAQFSVRGGILDIFPPNYSAPVRMEFWGDEIDMLSFFDLESQRRTDPVDQVVITPASECLFDSPEVLREKIAALKDKIKTGTAAEKLAADLTRLDSGMELYSIDKYLPLAYETLATILDYYEPDVMMFVSEYVSIKERAKSFSWQHHEDLKTLFEDGELCKGLDRYCAEFPQIQHRFSEANSVFLDTFARSNHDVKFKTILNINPIQTSNFSGELKVLYEDISPLLENGYCIAVLTGTPKAASNLAHDLQKMGINAEYAKDMKGFVMRKVYVLAGNISSGFEYPEIKFSLISTNKSVATQTRRSKYKKGKQIRSLDDLSQGDLVVHVSHGIGVFEGIQKMDLHGIVKDYIKIRYAGADNLYVPVTQLDLVSKYIGPKDENNIKLNKLNSGEWQKTKSRVRKACADMADELIALYAKRMKVKGHPFSEDTPWQREFEDYFPYEETEDQLRCIGEIKEDMERAVPMDRLLCGDVGFGKTEVALRAAFKCVMDSKQCAILCPTTILAWQHYQNAIQRFENFPIRIELLSRFRSPKQIKETVKKLKEGEVDIVIGTHRLVQKDIEFKDLGLAIIDEEQRFGVAHKEKFKQMFTSVDMLTLSATPIPRTLNMAMSGIRDMSTIEQAPQDRHPVQTYVLEYDLGIIGDAIKRELRRNGQVYYIHNRVETIDLCASKIHAIVPDAVIGVAHGKMSEGELSDIWRKLMQKEIDILICTTIIETGIDVKNCNTLIIENADYMGLSQLYQLRGRVGRSNRRAFAYFTFQRGKVLTEISSKRLAAIREFTTFGSGFRIAMRDLEIRGAGNILGGKQHGHMEAVGYDMYVRLLSEAIAQRKGEIPDQKSYECLIDVQLNAHIPESYIEDLSQRLDVYKKIASLHSESERMDLLDELLDRFGDVPKTVQTLLDVSLLRNTLASYGFREINQRAQSLQLIPEKLNPQIANQLAAGIRGRVMVNASQNPYITVKLQKNGDVVATMKEIASVLAAG